MKKLLLAFALFAGAATITTTSQAQVRVSFNIGSQPLWGPTGYDYAQYYYLPDVDAYYNVGTQQFIYQDGGRWGYYNSLPGRYRNYDLYSGYKVVVNERDPWMRNDYYRRQYYGYRGRHGQAFIRDSRDNRYWENPNHPYHNQWRGNGGYRDNGYRDGRRDDGYRGDRRDGGYRGDGRREGYRENGGYRGDDRRGGGGGFDQNRGGNDQNRGGNDPNRGGNDGNRGGFEGGGRNNGGEMNGGNGGRGNGQERPQQPNGNGGEPRQGGRR